VNVPALDAKLPFINRGSLRRQGIDDAVIENLEIETTPATTIGTGSQDGSIVHCSLLLVSSL
jgi:hypothetical protein